MALRETWSQIERLTQQMRQAMQDDPETTTELWHNRQRLLESVLNESSLAALSKDDLSWLRDATERLQLADQALQHDLHVEQKILIQVMRKQQGEAKAVAAYKTHQDQR